MPRNQASIFGVAAKSHQASGSSSSNSSSNSDGSSPAPEQNLPLPSRFMELMQMDSKELLRHTTTMTVPEIIELTSEPVLTGKATSQAQGAATTVRDSTVNVDRPLFQPFPSTVRFQNFKGSQTVSLPVAFRNIDSVARSLRVLPLESPYFEVVAPQSTANKVAPGVEVVYTVKFTPDTEKDYAEELVCVTERETFVVPIQAVGGRAIFDLPDSINFDTCVVKHPTTKIIAMRNIGSAAGKFTLEASPPFTVSPSAGLLAPNDVTQITIAFQPQACTSHTRPLVLRHGTGEAVAATLSGAGENAGVRLERSSLRFENTYITQQSQRSVRIANRSGVVARFAWKRFSRPADEAAVKHEVMEAIGTSQVEEQDEFLKMLSEDPTVSHGMSILARKHKDQQRAIEDDSQDFDQDDAFSVEPISGEIWPNSVSLRKKGAA